VWARRLWLTDSGLLRTPWRLALFLAIAAVVTAVVTGLIEPLVAATFALTGARLILFAWIQVVALLTAHAVMLRYVDRLPWSASALDRRAAAPSLIARGALLGGLAIGIPSLLLWAIGWLRLEPQPDGSTLVEGVRIGLALLPLALTEELLIRGYPLLALRSAMDWRLAVAGTSVVFGLLHAWNPGASAMSLGVVMVAGVMLGVVVITTGSLYAVTATHLAWNWVMAGVLHVPVSGLAFGTPDFRLVDAGPDWATGGSWGPEAGAGAVLGMSAATAYVYARWRRSERPSD
jgi:membrane protease YdiL (CAAX protease family)